MQNLKFSGCMTVSGLCMHDFGARASAPWKIFCCLLKFLLKKCYKCRVGSEKSESRGVGWLIAPRSLLGGACRSPHACTAPDCIDLVDLLDCMGIIHPYITYYLHCTAVQCSCSTFGFPKLLGGSWGSSTPYITYSAACH